PPTPLPPSLPYTTLFRSVYALRTRARLYGHSAPPRVANTNEGGVVTLWGEWGVFSDETPADNSKDQGLDLSSDLETSTAISLDRSEEHTSELQSRENLVC